jgi:hypothetical protein
VERNQPLRGIHVDYEPAGDPVYMRWLEYDLDEAPPKLVGGGDDREIPTKQKDPIHFPHRVVWDGSQPEVFVIVATTQNCDCKWVGKLYWEVNGKQRVTIIDNHGKPFRTTSDSNAPTYYSSGGEKLYPADAP